jgi:hypothetical protein
MKRYALIAVILAATLGGCQQPTDVRLQPDTPTSGLEVIPVVTPDPLIRTVSVDTGAVLPSDQLAYYGQLVIHSIILDAGPGRLDSFAYSKVLVADSVVRFLVRNVGFNGVDLGPVLLNGTPLLKIAHRIVVPVLSIRDTVLTRGVEYVGDFTQTYQPNQAYTWTAPLSTVGVLNVGINAPDKLVVLSPVGGSVIPRDRDLLLRWKGRNGQLNIIICTFDPLSKGSRPVLELRPRSDLGQALVPASILRQLPRDPYFVFTFILSNRKELTIIQGQTGKVLVQAASVYSSYIELR